jgi:DNA-binding transcriptional MerR regulator
MTPQILAAPVGRGDSDLVWIDVAHSDPVADPGAFTAGQMAEKLRVTTRTLSLYAGKGLVAPTRQGRCRVYGPLDQFRLALIVRARKLGFTLDEIAQMVAAEDGRASPDALRVLRQKCLNRIRRLESRLSEVTESLTELRRIHRAL